MRKKFIYGNYGTKLRLETVENLDHFLVEKKKKAILLFKVGII